MLSERFRFETSIFSVLKRVVIDNVDTQNQTTTGEIEGHHQYNGTSWADGEGNIVYGSTWIDHESIYEESVPTITSTTGIDDYLNLGMSFSFIITF